MAKRYKPKKKNSRRHRVSGTVGRRTRRRRRVGAMDLSLNPTSPMVIYGSIAVGYLMASKINAAIDKPVGDKLDGKIVAAGQIGVGAAYVFMMKGKKNLPLTVLSGLMIGAGAKRAMTEFGIGGIGPYGRVPAVSGAYGRVPVVSGRRRMGGYNPHGSLGSYTPNIALNGQSVRNVMGSVPDITTGSGITNSTGGDLMS